MYIYVDPQSYNNRHIAEIALTDLPEDCILTSDWQDAGKAEIIIQGLSELSGDMIREAANLKVIIRNAVGMDNIDLKTAKERGIPVYNLPLVNYESVAEMALGLMIDACRFASLSHACNRNGEERRYHRDYHGLELYGRTFGILGFGHIGVRLAEILKNAFKARVLIYDPYISEEFAKEKGVERYEDYHDILREADFISVHCPLTEQTRHMIDREALKLMGPQSVLVNTARAGIVDEEALYDALRNHEIFAAALDVMETEIGNKLFTLDNFVGTSHLGGNTREARLRVGQHLREVLLREISRIRTE